MSRPRPVELAVAFDDGTAVTTLINPQRDLADARKAFGISVSDVLLAPTLREAWAVIAPLRISCGQQPSVRNCRLRWWHDCKRRPSCWASKSCRSQCIWSATTSPTLWCPERGSVSRARCRTVRDASSNAGSGRAGGLSRAQTGGIGDEEAM